MKRRIVKKSVQPDQKAPLWVVLPFLVSIPVLLTLIGLWVYARQHPLSHLEAAAPAFWRTLNGDSTAPPLTEMMSTSLKKRYTPEALRGAFANPPKALEYATPAYIQHFKKNRHRTWGNATVHYQTPEGLIRSNWISRNYWFTDKGILALRWQVLNLCDINDGVKRSTQRFLKKLAVSGDAAFTLTLDHRYPSRRYKNLSPEELDVLKAQYAIDDSSDFELTDPVSYKNWAFVSAQQWNGKAITLTFSLRDYGKKGCRFWISDVLP